MKVLLYFIPLAFVAIGILAHLFEYAMGEYAARKDPENNVLINALLGLIAGIFLLLVLLAIT